MKQNLLKKIPILKTPQYLGTIVLLLISSLSFAGTVKAVTKATLATVKAAVIKGKVTDNGSGETLAGVSVRVKGTQIGSVTDANGNYTINAAGDATLVFSYVGYDPIEVAVGGRSTVTVSLTLSNKALTEVVVVGYGTQRKISVTGAVDKVNGDAVEQGRPVISVTQALQGESPNLIIQQKGFVPNGTNTNINIRGTGTTGNNDPLIVIDGIVGGDMNSLNPNDIDSFSILKDAGSAAIYGSRSANGVILITTKKGKAGAKPNVSYNGIYTDQHPRQTFQPDPEWLNATKKNISDADSGLPATYTDAQIANYKAVGDGNWRYSTILHDAPQINQNFSVSGGSPTNTYFMSFGYFNQLSNLEKNLTKGAYGLKRYNFRLNNSATLGKFNTSWILSYTKININEPDGGDPSGLIGDVFRAPLSDSFQDAQGRYIGGFVTQTGGQNGLDELRNGGYRYTNNDAINGSFTVAYSITKDLKIRAIFGGTVTANTQLQRRVDLKYFGSTQELNSSKNTLNTNNKNLATNTELLAEYTKSFGKNDLNVLVGVSNESVINQGNRVSKLQTDSLLGIPTTGTTVESNGNSQISLENTQESSLNSVFGRFQYSYANKYFLDGTLRADQSSNFPANKRWGYFPSIGASWRLTEESFMSDFKQKVGDIRIRSTYGTLGNQNVNPYQFISTYGLNGTGYAFGNASTGTARRSLSNPDLTWESAATFDLGANGSFLNGKLNIDVDYYNKNTSNILATRADVPTLFGSALPTYNISKVQVRGWEFKASYSIRGKEVTHNISFNIADNLSKLLQYSFGQTENVFQREEFDFVKRVGQPIFMYQGYKMAGIYQSVAEAASAPKFPSNTVTAGDVKFVDKNGDGHIGIEDKYILGNPFPRYTFGFTYNVTYKGFDAQVFIQGVLKRMELVRGEEVEAYHFTTYGGTSYNTAPETDFWSASNHENRWPMLSEHGSNANNNDFRVGSDMYAFNMAYARLKNLQIGYTLPVGLTSKVGIQRARIYATAQNIVTISPFKLADPEQTEFGNNLSNTAGAETPRSYTTPEYYGVGLDITF